MRLALPKHNATLRWEIYAEDSFTLPMGLRFNVLVIKV